MKSSEYLQHDAVGLAELVARGETTAAELLELALGQSAKEQPKTNAIGRMMESEACSQLKKQLTGPFAGVPFLIKDCAQDYAGLPTTYGSRATCPCGAALSRRGGSHLRQDELAGACAQGRLRFATVRPHQQSLECRSHARRLQR